MTYFRFQKLSLIALGAAGALSTPAMAATLNVCQSGCAYSLPSQALNAAAAGDTISIASGTYNDCMYITKDNITVVGTGTMPAMTGKVCGQKGIIVTAGKNAVIRNLELYGASDNENYAGIRHDAAGSNLTLDNVYIHDNDDGLLSSASGDTLLIQNSKFYNNGMNAGSGMAHNMYIGGSASFTFRNSQSLHAKLGGHALKSRAAKTIVDGSVIATVDGEDSRSLDISNGGQVTITNSVIEKGPNSQNNDLIGYGPEGLNSAYTHTFTMTGTTVIEDRGNGPAVDFYNQPSSISISGNKFIGPDAISNAGATSSNTTYASRAAAGMPAFPYLPSAGTPATPTPTPTATATPTPTPTATSSPSPSPTATGSNWVKCASESGTCTFNGTHTVRYGAGSSWTTKTATGSIACNNSVFGDPIVGTAKECDVDMSSTTPSPTPTATATPTPTPTATATPSPSPTSTGSNWVKCAAENGTCTFNGTYTIRYGTGTSWTTKVATGSIACSNSTFGDPAYGYTKECDIDMSSAPTNTWTMCATEGGTCSFSGTKTVRYGAGTKWYTKTATGSIACNNATFGDPIVGTAKECDYQ
ncbi:MAG: hypothetical protein ACJ763_04000 [Bdellovibrionia bacterium]